MASFGAPESPSEGAPACRNLLTRAGPSPLLNRISKAKWLVAALVPAPKRRPLKKLDADAPALLKLLQRWRDEADRTGHPVKRIAVAYEAGGDGFWLARWLKEMVANWP